MNFLDMEGDKFIMASRGFFLLLFMLLLHPILKAEWDTERLGQESLDQEALDYTYSSYISDIINSFLKQMKVELGIQCSGDGRIRDEDVEVILLKFIAYRRATIDEARALILFTMDKFLEAINAHEKIQPFLAEKPFCLRNISLSIHFEGANGIYSDGSVASIKLTPNKSSHIGDYTITYSRSDPIFAPYIHILSETSEEALKNAKAAALSFPYAHQTTALEAAMDEIFLEYSSKVWIQRGLECRNIGGKMNNGVEEIGAVFYLVHSVSQEQAREIAVYIVETLLEMLNQHENIRPYLNPYPFQPQKLKFELEFTNYKYTPHREGISKVILDNDLSYFKEMRVFCGNEVVEAWAHSTDLVHQESYIESLEIVNSTPFSLLKKIHNAFECGFRWIFVPTRPKS